MKESEIIFLEERLNIANQTISQLNTILEMYIDVLQRQKRNMDTLEKENIKLRDGLWQERKLTDVLSKQVRTIKNNRGYRSGRRYIKSLKR